jgi:hypothetical protein
VIDRCKPGSGNLWKDEITIPVGLRFMTQDRAIERKCEEKPRGRSDTRLKEKEKS